MRYFFCMGIICLCVLNTLFCEEGPLEAAFVKYTEAEHAKTAEEKRKGFNEALKLYLDALSTSNSGKLYYNIGNCYFQLNEFGFAIYYYYKALHELPRDTQILDNMNIALSKVGLPPQKTTVVDRIFFFYTQLSPFEKNIWAFGFFLFTFSFFSLYIWLPYGAFRLLSIFSLLVGTFLFFGILWQDYFASPEAVVVHTVSLQRGSNNEYARASGDPLLMGLKVRVIEVTDTGDWLKVRSPSGQEGYVPQENVRVL